ncbi:hypothetical protein L6164_028767 [Bauhinia variegata]|uniref:Uncharacterized protein n=1 Tax=Bauhinia variegata TaxID=167791 RepID=A0ACB9L7Q2_BAUVA|nr:hypothetical protein L6164_028767 [Bauhinia variegata]
MHLEFHMESAPTAISGHIVAMPYPGRGHINPLMNLCKLLVSKNNDLHVTFVVTEEWLGFIGSEPKPDNIRFSTIPNVIPSELGRGKDFVAFFDAVMTKMEAPFQQLLDRLELLPTMIIHDTFLFWVVGEGNRRNIPVASFFTMSASIFSFLHHFHLFNQNGHYPVNLLEKGDERVDYIPGLSSTRLADFPLLDGNCISQHLLQWFQKGFSAVQKAQYLLFPSIYELESQVIEALKAKLLLPIYTIAPVIPYFSLGDTPSLSINDYCYLKWLDNQPSASVLYISHGSFVSVSSAQMDEIAAGLRESGVRFLWVARGEASRLKGICGDMGLVLEWCDQLRVLLHPAIGGFCSHCGWNSTREGVFAGAPFLTFPILMDQPLNSKLIVEDWKIGWRVKRELGMDTLVRREDIAVLLHKFMDLDSDSVREMRKRARELQQVYQLALAIGGSSETNINAFVKDIIESANKYTY